MAVLQRLLEYLDKNQVAYFHDVHPVAYTARGVASVEHIREHMLAKVVVFYSEKGYGIAVLPADCMVNLEELRLDLGVSRLRLATEPELSDLFPNCELGAMPPFGNGCLYDLPVFVDSELAGEETIAFNAGTHRDIVQMKYRDYINLVKPIIIHFSKRIAAATT